MGRKEVPRGGHLLSARHSLLSLYMFPHQLLPAFPRGRYYFTVAETGAQKVKELAQEHTASKWKSPDSNPRPSSSYTCWFCSARVEQARSLES